MSLGRKLNVPGACLDAAAMVGRPSPQNPDQPITLVTRSDKLHFPGELAEPHSRRHAFRLLRPLMFVLRQHRSPNPRKNYAQRSRSWETEVNKQIHSARQLIDIINNSEQWRTMYWRKGWDSNPRYPCRHAGFQDRFLKPLGHPSGRVIS